MNALQGKAAVITGGGTGIGKSIALLFASEGAKVLICGRRAEQLKDVYEGHGAYGVAKPALVTLGEYIQKENQELGIHVNTICPGVVLTDMIRDEPNLHPEKSLSPDEIADLVLWLVTKRPNVKFGTPILIQTMENPWE